MYIREAPTSRVLIDRDVDRRAGPIFERECLFGRVADDEPRGIRRRADVAKQRAEVVFARGLSAEVLHLRGAWRPPPPALPRRRGLAAAPRLRRLKLVPPRPRPSVMRAPVARRRARRCEEKTARRVRAGFRLRGRETTEGRDDESTSDATRPNRPSSANTSCSSSPGHVGVRKDKNSV